MGEIHQFLADIEHRSQLSRDLLGQQRAPEAGQPHDVWDVRRLVRIGMRHEVCQEHADTDVASEAGGRGLCFRGGYDAVVSAVQQEDRRGGQRRT